MLGDKLRFRFAKTGTLRLLSHHDLMRCLERMLRRADLPFKSTAGFHPGPRVVFALSLPLGVVGLRRGRRDRAHPSRSTPTTCSPR